MFRKPQCTGIWCYRAAASAWRIRNASSQTHSLSPAVLERRPLTRRGAFPCFLPTTTTLTATGLRENKGSIRLISFKVSRYETGALDQFVPELDIIMNSLLALAAAGVGILLGGYMVWMEEPKRLIYMKALKRIQNVAQITERIGSPITSYGQDSENSAVNQTLPYRVWSNGDGVEHAEANFYIRGAHGQGKVFSKMIKGPVDSEWKFTYLIVDIEAPSPAHFILVS